MISPPPVFYSLKRSKKPSDVNTYFCFHLIGDDQLSSHSEMAFTTKDQDNDESGSNCASSEIGGWWYKNCGHVNLNGGGTTSLYWGSGNNLIYSEMKIRLFQGKRTPINSVTNVAVCCVGNVEVQIEIY